MTGLSSLAGPATIHTTNSLLEVSIEGIDVWLLSKRGLYWPDQRTLFIADTHFGKEATFRSQGVSVPRGSTQGTLATIAKMISECQASRLILLGDMFHARSSLSHDIQESLEAFFAFHSQLRFTLVLGNHDRGIQALPMRFPFLIFRENLLHPLNFFYAATFTPPTAFPPSWTRSESYPAFGYPNGNSSYPRSGSSLARKSSVQTNRIKPGLSPIIKSFEYKHVTDNC